MRWKMSKRKRLEKLRARPAIGFDEWKTNNLDVSTLIGDVDIAWEFLKVVAKDLRVEPTQIDGGDKFRRDLFPGSICDYFDQPYWIDIGEELTDVLRPKLPVVDWSSVNIELDTTVRDIITQMVSVAQTYDVKF